MDSYQKLVEATEYLKPFITESPRIGVVLGSGLGNFTKEIIVAKEIEYDAIPHFPVSTVEGHHGQIDHWFHCRKTDYCDGRAFSFLRRLYSRRSCFPS